ncbi:hypothetical protein FJU30_04640 [Affinibrenneria salicis]|uniref:Uncharacterized protein n=1 Tax=Affinibrenneria salicis TaxID=2590031 RepID=A0A5J5G7U5_9GAMM|nr:hypothetical protein FJU30_00125 [Affinibrenneria salicis]KAA9003341.1 hypothetical protein FJU30_04640 [Affinibrenneria salicis]
MFRPECIFVLCTHLLQACIERFNALLIVLRFQRHLLGYARKIESEKHLTGKIFTQRLERHNLHFRIHLKRLAGKITCFPVHLKYMEKSSALKLKNIMTTCLTS